MTDKERLEKLKQQKVWKDATGFVFLTVSVDDYKFLYEKAKHVSMYEDAAEKANAVIEQTNEENIALRERVQELEKANKTLSDNHFQQIEQHKSLVQQNKGLHEALKETFRIIEDIKDIWRVKK